MGKYNAIEVNSEERLLSSLLYQRFPILVLEFQRLLVVQQEITGDACAPKLDLLMLSDTIAWNNKYYTDDSKIWNQMKESVRVHIDCDKL